MSNAKLDALYDKMGIACDKQMAAKRAFDAAAAALEKANAAHEVAWSAWREGKNAATK